MQEAVRPGSARELKDRLEARRAGGAFLAYRDADGNQCLRPLRVEEERVTIGRSPSCGLALEWDAEVSRVHAELVRAGDAWVIEDDGLSRNGTLVNGERLRGRRRLHDGDLVRAGASTLVFHDPVERGTQTTVVQTENRPAVAISPAQRRVLVALCRPLAHDQNAVPATNPQIAQEVFLSVDAVKTHMRALFARFGLEALPQNEKRRRLVALAFDTGAVTEADFDV